MSAIPETVRLALVYDGGDGNLLVADLKRIYPLSSTVSPNVFLLETEPFCCPGLQNGAGPEFTKDEIKVIISYLKNNYLSKHENTK